MQEIGIVKKLDGEYAIVEVAKKSACEGCAVGSVCKDEGDDVAQIRALNTVLAKQGDRVVVSFDSITYIKGSLLVYALPVVLMVIGAIAGRQYLPAFLPTFDPEGLSALGGFLCLAIGLAIVKILSHYFAKKQTYIPAVTKIL